MLSLRIRSPSGQSTIQLPPNATLAQLKHAIQDKAAIVPARQELRTGFPPKPVPVADDTVTLNSLGITTGESIVVVELDAPAAAPPATQRPASPAQAHVRTPAQVHQPAATRLAGSNAADFIFDGESGGGGEPESVECDGGWLVHRVVPDDNSCLFTALALVLCPGQPPHATAQVLRQTVADAIEADAESWSDAILGHPRASYVSTILQASSWGGAIELLILAKHFGTEVCSVDVQSGRVDRFGEGEGRVWIVYSGIHFDALTLAFAKPSPSPAGAFPPPNLEFDTTSFPISGPQADAVRAGALQLATALRAKHAYTDAANFTLTCEECGLAIVGEVEARQHAKERGHTRFGEYAGI